jgi:Short C-terminal domain
LEYLLPHINPQECLNRAEAYMAGEGYSIQNRTESSITFGWKPKIGGGMQALLLGNALLNPKQASQDLTALNTISGAGTLTATPHATGGTRVTLGGPLPLQKQLSEWIEGDLLNWSTKPLMKLHGGKKEMRIFDDRTEVYEGFSEPRALYRVTAEQLEEVTNKGWIYTELALRSREGETATLGYLDERKAKKAKKLIEEQVPKQPAPAQYQQLLTSESASESAARIEAKDQAGDIPTLIRQLAELRDAGILSNEEFEAKKNDLLKRL